MLIEFLFFVNKLYLWTLKKDYIAFYIIHFLDYKNHPYKKFLNLFYWNDVYIEKAMLDKFCLKFLKCYSNDLKNTLS